MANLMNETKNAAEIAAPPARDTAVAADGPPRPAQRLLGYVTPVVNRVADGTTAAFRGTQSAVEKRLGFCPGKVVAKAVSSGLDALGNGLLGASKQLRKVAGVEQKT
jgi:hypothetical protein